MRHYCRGLPHAREFRGEAAVVSTLDELRRLIEAYCAGLADRPGWADGLAEPPWLGEDA
jgi:hypothetical protein